MEDSAALRAELFWAVGMQDSGDVVMFAPKPLPEGPPAAAAPGADACPTVVGAGESRFNGEYMEDGSESGKVRYRRRGGGVETMNYNSGSWYMCEDHSGSWYKVDSRADQPPADGWQVGSRGTSPAPTVRFGPPPETEWDRVERIRRERSVASADDLAAEADLEEVEALSVLDAKDKAWVDLTEAEKEAVSRLGVSEESWDAALASDDAGLSLALYEREWDSLSEAELRAAEVLGMSSADFGSTLRAEHTARRAEQRAACADIAHLCENGSAAERQRASDHFRAEGAAPRVICAMQRYAADGELVASGCRALACLAQAHGEDSDRDDAARDEVAKDGAVNAALKALSAHKTDPRVSREACAALHNFVLRSDENKAALLKGGGIAAVLDTIERHSDRAVVLTAAYVLLCSLAMRSATRKKLVAANAIKATVGTIGSHRAEESVLLPACELLTKLTTSKSEKRAAGDAGAISALVRTLEIDGVRSQIEKSTTPLVLGEGADTPTISADNLGQFMVTLHLMYDDLRVDDQIKALDTALGQVQASLADSQSEPEPEPEPASEQPSSREESDVLLSTTCTVQELADASGASRYPAPVLLEHEACHHTQF